MSSSNDTGRSIVAEGVSQEDTDTGKATSSALIEGRAEDKGRAVDMGRADDEGRAEDESRAEDECRAEEEGGAEDEGGESVKPASLRGSLPIGGGVPLAAIESSDVQTGVSYRPYRIAVFASGGGSNFQALADAAAAGELGGAELALLVCDRPKAAVVERAARAGVESFVIRPKDYASREDYEHVILAELTRRSIDLIVLAGYMRLITATLLTPYEGRMINVHPSLLPAFPGVNAIGQAVDYGVKVTGVTVHFVDGGMDTGPIIAQRAVEIREDDTESSLAERIHAAEHALYPAVVRDLAQGRICLSGRQVTRC